MDLSEARIDRLWMNVSSRLARPRRSVPLGWPIVAVCALAGAVLVVRSFHPSVERASEPAPPPAIWDGAPLETGPDALAVSLADGSTLKLEPRSRVEIGDRTPSAVRLSLSRGRIACDVTHRPGRSFVVAAAGVEVHVVGTRFSVATEKTGGMTRVDVQVERGVVEVHGAGRGADTVRVEAGRSWSQVTGPSPAARDAAPAAPPSQAGPPAIPPAGRATGQAAPIRVAALSPTRPGAPRAAAVADARKLFEQARVSWREGRIQEAAETYQALLATFPADPRAGLAAFELGRLRMDRLNDLPGAVRALERAVALAPGAELREDALARLVAASAGAHDQGTCERARDQYLAAYPSGVHRRTVAAACAAR
ncbi:MAG: FecR domain-containing protein [Verrucomicrobiota bacterium]